MSNERSEPTEAYEWDELTNRILAEYPVQCVSRTGPLGQKHFMPTKASSYTCA
ncbi:hypothetical protein [Cohnella faecalis]|uniref:hypothetical protein n=1 Tax=Cohnella faecalis TaxID=2315694 RepID=UPI00131436D3|nr:hypothetical protein [Cohnella faecalis]